MFALQTILQPTDYSEGANAAFQLACVLARDHGGRVIVLHVAPGPLANLGGMDAVPPVPVEHDYAALMKELRKIQSPFPEVKVTHLLAEGISFEEILRAAGDTACDLIVMGTHGRTGLGRLVMGSVAEQVVRKALCPVLTVKMPVAKKVSEACGAAPQLATV